MGMLWQFAPIERLKFTVAGEQIGEIRREGGAWLTEYRGQSCGEWATMRAAEESVERRHAGAGLLAIRGGRPHATLPASTISLPNVSHASR